MTTIPIDQLLVEVQEIIRSMPGLRDFSANPDKCIPWLGRANSAMVQWDAVRAITHFEPMVKLYAGLQTTDQSSFTGFRQKLLVLLHQADNDLRMRTSGPLSIGISAGRVFEYFDELRKLIESARSDLLIVDPYLDADFISRYLPFVAVGTQVRMLARERLSTLKPAIEAFKAQSSALIEAISISNFHDRYLFVDKQACFQSGASFKDGAKKTPTTLVQITDAFAAVMFTYEKMWTEANARW